MLCCLYELGTLWMVSVELRVQISLGNALLEWGEEVL